MESKIQLPFRRILIAVLALGASAVGAQQFTWEKPLPQGNHLLDVTFRPASNVGYAVGYGGTILKTTNSSTWTAQTSPTTQRLQGIDCAQDDVCWAVGTGGTIIKTVNGSTWALQTSGTSSALLAVSALDTNNVWAVGTSATILRTTNGGSTWTTVTPPDTGVSHLDVKVINANVVYVLRSVSAVTPQQVLKTINAGSAWTEQTPQAGVPFTSMDFVDANNGVVVGSGSVRHTTNGGMTWTAATLPADLLTLNSVDLVDATTAYAVGVASATSSHSLAKVTNANAATPTWTAQTVTQAPPAVIAQGIACSDTTHCTAVGYGGLIDRTLTGIGWSMVAQGVGNRTINSIAMATGGAEFIGVAVGTPAMGEPSLLAYRGVSRWTQVSSTPSTVNLNDVVTAANGTKFDAWAVGEGGTILATLGSTDFSSGWTVQSSGLPNALYGIDHVSTSGSNQTVVAVGQAGSIMRTTNSGGVWNALSPTPTTSDLNAVHFPNTTTGYAVGGNTTFLRSTNGGLNWTGLSPTGLTGGLTDVSFASVAIGAVASTDGIFVTTDGASTFTLRGNFRCGGHPPQDVWMPDSSTIYASVLSCVHVSRDLGKSWTLLTTPADATTAVYSDVKGLFGSFKEVLVAGDHERILRTQCAGNGRIGCDDFNSCTTDACTTATGECTHTPLTGPVCDDRNACTTGETCQAGVCKGADVSCDDQNGCTTDSCSSTLGCRHAPVASGTICDDSNSCTSNDKCNATGQCLGTGKQCNDDNPCTIDGCGVDGGCQFVNRDAGVSCDDNSVCTVGERCNAAGACVAIIQVSCSDSNSCTADKCDSVSGCSNTPLDAGTACNDNNGCTTGDVCAAGGTCTPGSATRCDDGNPCTADSCDAVTGCAHTPIAAGTACDDGNSCTMNDVCNAGACQGVGMQCNDNNPCTQDSCSAGVCSYKDVAASTPCDDGDVCTTMDQCSGMKCGGQSKSCDDSNACTADSCTQATGACVNEPQAGKTCDDGNQCTKSETCSAAGVCGAGDAVVCNDSKSCTKDVCEPTQGCVFTPMSECETDGGTGGPGGKLACGCSSASEALFGLIGFAGWLYRRRGVTKSARLTPKMTGTRTILGPRER